MTRTPAKLGPIGFIGLGAMGAPMARRLAGLGYEVLVHDLDTAAVRSVVNAGARAGGSPKAIASKARLVLTCLPSLGALKAVILGPEGLIAGDAMETLVDFSTTGADFAREMATALEPRGIGMLAAPITGNVITAGNGGLGVMCSGSQAAFDHAEPVMRDLASAALLYLGKEPGKAQTLKLLNNLLSATGMAASCEAFILGVKAGLDPQAMLAVINNGDASSSASRNKFPRSVLPRQFDFGARMAITAKDISLSVKEAEELGVPMWIGQAVRQIWQYAVSQGGSEKDGTSLITFLEPWAGVVVRAEGNAASRQIAQPAPPDIGEYILVCETGAAAALAQRLRDQPHCVVIAVPAGSGAADVMAALPARRARARAVLNACLMPSAQAAELALALAERGDEYLDALPGGTGPEIENGSTALIVGGSPSLAAVARPVLDAIGRRIFHVGDKPGAAHVMQQINGSLFATLLAVTCESFVAGARAGLDPLMMTKILGLETGKNAASARIIPQQVATRKFQHGKRIDEALRELTLASDEARSLGITPWILDKTRLLYGLAAQLGSAGDDMTRLVTHYEKWASVEVVSPHAP